MVKILIKNKDKTVKKASRDSVLDFLSRLSLFMAGWAAAVGVGVNATLAIDKQIRFRTYSNDLTPVSQMQENIDKMGLNSVIIDFENGRNARFMFPKNGKITFHKMNWINQRFRLLKQLMKLTKHSHLLIQSSNLFWILNRKTREVCIA